MMAFLDKLEHDNITLPGADEIPEHYKFRKFMIATQTKLWNR